MSHFLLGCGNSDCDVIGFRVDANGKVLKVWRGLKESTEDFTLEDIDLDFEPNAEETIKMWESENAAYLRNRAKNSKNLDREMLPLKKRCQKPTKRN